MSPLTPYMLWIKLGAAAIAIAAIIGAIGVYGHSRYKAGQDDTQAKWNKAIEKGKKEVERLTNLAGQVTTVVETEYVDRIKTVREKADVIIREVPRYVPVGACALPGGFRVLHDAAASGTVPDPAAVPDAAPVDAQVVAGAVASNYGTCHETEARLTSLQDWVRQQKAANP